MASNSLRGNVWELHNSEGGMSEISVGKESVWAYTRSLLYLSSPSTIRARVRDEYGRAPSLEQIRTLKAEYETTRRAFKENNEALGGEPEDRHHFRVGRVELWPFEKNDKPREKKSLSRLIQLAAKDDAERQKMPDVPVPPRIHSETIAAVAKCFRVTAADITGRSRKGHIMAARKTAIYILCQRGASLPQVGRWINRDHSSILYLIRQFEWNATPQMRDVAARFLATEETNEPA